MTSMHVLGYARDNMGLMMRRGLVSAYLDIKFVRKLDVNEKLQDARSLTRDITSSFGSALL